MPKNSDAQDRLNTPSDPPAPGAGVPAATGAAVPSSGKSAWPRSFQVISGTAASTRRSYPASSSASAPP